MTFSGNFMPKRFGRGKPKLLKIDPAPTTTGVKWAKPKAKK